MYLFKNASNKWIFGDTINDECPSGIFRTRYNTDFTKVSIVYAAAGTFFKKERDITFFTDSTGTPYVDLSAFLTATDGFFLGSAGGTLTDSAGNVLLPSGTPAKIIVELTRPNDTPGAYTIGDAINSSVASPAAFEFANASIAAGGGGLLGLLKLESNITALASGTLRLWFFNEAPINIVGDHVAYINEYANSSKRCFYIDVTFDPLLAGSDTVFAQTLPLFNEYVTTNKSIYCLIQTLSSFTPTASGKIKISLSLIKIA